MFKSDKKEDIEVLDKMGRGGSLTVEVELGDFDNWRI